MRLTSGGVLLHVQLPRRRGKWEGARSIFLLRFRVSEVRDEEMMAFTAMSF